MADQVAVPATPQVPDIATPASVPVPDMENINQAIDTVAKQLQAPLPSPYSKGSNQAQPTVPNLPQYQPSRTDNQPMGPTLHDKKQAAQKNDWAEVGNAVSQAVGRYEQQKQDKLKGNIVTVMQAKQQVANAKSVLDNPDAPQNAKAMAKQVLEANTKRINDIMSDKKIAKDMAKAFDVSYSDPEKNKTPQVMAGIAAHKEVQKAGAFNAQNPQEAAVAKIAAMPTQAPQKVHSDTGTPEVMQANPKAAAVLAKDTPTMEANPQYAAALQQKETAQKQMMALAPHLIDAKAKADLAAYTAGNAAVREQYKAVTAMQQTAYKATAQAERLTASDKNALQRVYAEGTNQVRTVMARARAAMGVSGDKRLDAATKEKIGQQQLHSLAADLDAANKARTALDLQNSAAGISQAEHDRLQTALDFNGHVIQQLMALREQTAQKFFPDSVEKQQQAQQQTNAPQPEQPSALSRFWDTLTAWPSPKQAEERQRNAGQQQPAIEPVGNTTDQPSESGKDDGSEDSDQY